MNLRTYFERLQNTLSSRRDITIEHLEVILADTDGYLEARVRFHDESLLVFSEEVELTATKRAHRISYAFHYQSGATYFSATTIRPIIHTLLPFQRISTLAMKLLPQKRLIWRMY